MWLDSKVFGLPASIILLIAAQSTAAFHGDQSPAQRAKSLPRKVTYLFDDAADEQLDLETRNEQTPLGKAPIGVMKMSDDPGEKFYMEYWHYKEELDVTKTQLRIGDEEEARILLANVSSYKAPFALHTEGDWIFQGLKSRGMLGRDKNAAWNLLKRQFTCPTGTADCSAIGQPDSCCATDETCFTIQDTGLGPVGCCPKDANCGGTISACNSPNTPCTDNSGGNYQGGGCCIPNYVCAGVGCVINPSLVVTVVVTESPSASSQPSSTSTVVTTVTPLTTTETYTGLQTTLSCTNGAHACPVNLGGGCCNSGYVCASSSTCVPTSTTTTISTNLVTVTGSSGVTGSSTATGVAPARPTGSTSISAAPTVTDSSGSCPTGFYACEAYYAGGCCRTGRNCDTTSCPATSSTTIISSGVTVVVPVGAAATLATPSGACASGWSTCAASVGGNCCPSGWQCGTASCTSISPTQTGIIQKGSPSTSNRNVVRWVIYAPLIGCLMMVLGWT